MPKAQRDRRGPLFWPARAVHAHVPVPGQALAGWFALNFDSECALRAGPPPATSASAGLAACAELCGVVCASAAAPTHAGCARCEVQELRIDCTAVLQVRLVVLLSAQRTFFTYCKLQALLSLLGSFSKLSAGLTRSAAQRALPRSTAKDLT